MQVNPTTVERNLWADQVLATHEMTHIIGFSRTSFPLFRKPNNEPYMARWVASSFYIIHIHVYTFMYLFITCAIYIYICIYIIMIYIYAYI